MFNKDLLVSRGNHLHLHLRLPLSLLLQVSLQVGINRDFVLCQCCFFICGSDVLTIMFSFFSSYHLTIKELLQRRRSLQYQSLQLLLQVPSNFLQDRLCSDSFCLFLGLDFGVFFLKGSAEVQPSGKAPVSPPSTPASVKAKSTSGT